MVIIILGIVPMGDVVMGMHTGKIWKLGLIEIGIVLYGLLG